MKNPLRIEKYKMKKLLMFHPIIAPYRIDMVNKLATDFDMRLCLLNKNLVTQKFDIDTLYKERLRIKPTFIQEKRRYLGIDIPVGLSEIIDAFNPDIVLVWEFGAVVWQVLFHRWKTNAQYKVISLVDDSYDMLVSGRYISRRHRIAQKLVMPFIDQVINVEPRAVEWYRQKYKKGIYFPIISEDLGFRERLERVLPISEELLERFHLVGKRVLLYVGRLASVKNLYMAVEAFKKANVKDAVFVLVGDGEERDNLKVLAGEDPTIQLVGRYEGDALYAWYNVASVFILPSMVEPFGAVTNEALLAGCYSLVSKHAGSSCLVKENVNGNIINPKNEEQITCLINEKLNTTRISRPPLSVKSNRMSQPFEAYFSNLKQALMNV